MWQKQQRALVRLGRVAQRKQPVAARADPHFGEVAVAVVHAEQEAAKLPLVALRQPADGIRDRRRQHDQRGKDDHALPFAAGYDAQISHESPSIG